MSATASFLERLRGEGEDREVDPYERVRGGIKWASGRLRGGVNEAIEWVWLKATGRPRGGAVGEGRVKCSTGGIVRIVVVVVALSSMCNDGIQARLETLRLEAYLKSGYCGQSYSNHLNTCR